MSLFLTKTQEGVMTDLLLEHDVTAPNIEGTIQNLINRLRMKGIDITYTELGKQGVFS